MKHICRGWRLFTLTAERQNDAHFLSPSLAGLKLQISPDGVVNGTENVSEQQYEPIFTSGLMLLYYPLLSDRNVIEIQHPFVFISRLYFTQHFIK